MVSNETPIGNHTGVIYGFGIKNNTSIFHKQEKPAVVAISGWSYIPRYFIHSYTRKTGHIMAFKKPSTPIQKEVAVEM